MNVFEVFKCGSKRLEESGIENFDFDSRCLLEFAFGFDKNGYFLNRLNSANEENTEKFFGFIERRISGEPLQYILGKWGFMDGEFYVGDGVLIPRQDTELLVETAIDYIRCHKEVKNVCDLCSGSGCVGISIAMSFPEINVYCVELSDKAFSFLERNIKLNNVSNAKAVKGDINNGIEFFGFDNIDVIVSNPPYIETSEIPTLSTEVQNEPHMALDGGNDGLDFYRVIAEKWISLLKSNAFAAFECGENQAKMLSELFSEFSSETKIYKDFNGIERVVSLIKN